MIILINGPFGVGKTSIGTMLKDKINNSMIYDPEEVGFMLRNIIPNDIRYVSEKSGDFQDLKLWKVLTVEIAKMLLETYKRNLIIPMTICDLIRFNYIYDNLKKIDNTVFHFCLLAKKNIIHDRLIKRGDKEGSWPFQQTDKCLKLYQNNLESFNEIIYTDNLREDLICQKILESVFS